MARLLLLLLQHQLARGLRVRDLDGAAGDAVVDQSWTEHPKGPLVEPVGRHIQMLYWNSGHGLTDRMLKYFRPLIALGEFYNATVHLLDGENGVKRFLTNDHTLELGTSWARYFDTKANNGNPFHAPQNFRGCRIVQRLDNSILLDLFEGKRWSCVNIETNTPIHGLLPRPLRQGPRAPKAILPPSGEIVRAAQAFLQRYNVPPLYGSVHVRRCDYFQKAVNCTAPAAISKDIQNFGSGLRTWLFFTYAERGYGAALAKELAPLQLQTIFEDEVVLNDVYPKDNYFTYLLGKYLNGGAATILETHHCSGASAHVLQKRATLDHGLYLPEMLQGDTGELTVEDLGEMFLESQELAGAVCDSRGNGAKLLQPGIPDSEALADRFASPEVRQHQR